MIPSSKYLPLPWGEGAPQGWVRGTKPLIYKTLLNSRTPHPPCGHLLPMGEGKKGDAHAY